MDIREMHIYFRQYAQQMGLQNTRAILPEQIDILINTSITDTINQIIRENIGVTNDRVISDNSKIGQINALRTLYQVKELSMLSGGALTWTDDNTNENAGYARSFYVKPSETKIGKFTTNNDIYNKYLTAKAKDESDRTAEEAAYVEAFEDSTVGGYKEINLPSNVMFYVDFALNYIPGEYPIYVGTSTSPKYKESIITPNGEITNYFPVRLIDDAYLADTLNDFILKPSLRSPILVVYNNNTFDLYIDKLTKTITTAADNNNYYALDHNLIPYNLRISYVAKPATVVYSEDLNGTNVDCNLPEYLHVDIVKHAVDLYRVAVSGSLYSARQQEEAQQRENMRNNYRNEQQ